MTTPYIMAVDLGGTQIRAALCDAAGQIYRRVAKPTLAEEGPEPVIQRITDAIAEALDGSTADEISGIGIGSPGPLDPMTGVVLSAPNLPGWHDVPLRSIVSEKFDRPAYLGNDANVAGLAETLYGAARGVRDVIYLTISTGVGSGIIVDGRMLLGTRGLAGEAGHTVVAADGPLCGCGNRGCVEAFASGTGIRSYVLEQIAAGVETSVLALVGGDRDRIGARIVAEAARLGDPLSQEAFRRAGRYLGIGVTNLLYLFNPRMVVLGGSVTKAGPLLTEPMWEAICSLAKPGYIEGLSIVPAALGDDVVLLGAVALVAQEQNLLGACG
jgi:glucokinase